MEVMIFFWNEFEVGKLGGKKIQPGDDDEENDFKGNFQAIVSKRTFLEQLNDNDILSCSNMLKTLQIDQDKTHQANRKTLNLIKTNFLR